MFATILNVIKLVFMFCYVWGAGAVIVLMFGVDNAKWWHWVALLPLPLLYASLKNMIMTKEIGAASPKRLWEEGSNKIEAGAWSSGHVCASFVVGLLWLFFCMFTAPTSPEFNAKMEKEKQATTDIQATTDAEAKGENVAVEDSGVASSPAVSETSSDTVGTIDTTKEEDSSLRDRIKKRRETHRKGD